jgi:hypothetical protein
MDYLDLFLGCVLALALIVAIVYGVCWMDDREAARHAVARQRAVAVAVPVARHNTAGALRFSCASDAVAISSLDQLNNTVILYDTLMHKGDYAGRKVPLREISVDAGDFVRQFGDAERGAFLMEQCLGRLAQQHRDGYDVLYAAFTRRIYGNVTKPLYP